MTAAPHPKKAAAVLGGGGFVGSLLVRRLKREGYWVRAVDFSRPPFSCSAADEFVEGDLRDPGVVELALRLGGRRGFDLVFQLAADMPVVHANALEALRRGPGGACVVYSSGAGLEADRARFTERLYLSFARAYGVPVRIARHADALGVDACVEEMVRLAAAHGEGPRRRRQYQRTTAR